MIDHGNEIQVFSGNSNRPLAEAIAKKLNTTLGPLTIKHFSDGEIYCRYEESIRGKDVFLIQSTSAPTNDNLMELLVMIDAAKRASAGRITAVIPYYGYARQDRKAKSREPISAKLVANLLFSAGANRVLTMDIHCLQIQGFFDIPFDNLSGSKLLTSHFKPLVDENFVVVSPDVGSVARARKVATELEAKIAIIDKRRPKPNVMEVMNIIGDVEGKSCLMIDDIIDTAGTIVQGAVALKNAGAKEIYVGCSHGVLSGPAIERLANSPINEVAILDTIHIPESKIIPKFHMISSAALLASAIDHIYSDRPMSNIYDNLI